MTFVNFSLLAGAALVALPIVLHLIMQRRPTLIEFPALRFVQHRHDANRRRLRLRHLLLLLLRAGAIALLAFALARPSVKLAGVLGSREAPVAAALVFDAAPRMQYRHQNQTRLEAAKELGLWLLAQLPPESELTVIDTRLGAIAAQAADRGAARERVARLDTVANSQPLPMAIEAAAERLQQSALERKEFYVFTDLSRAAWPQQQSARLSQQLAQLGSPGLYLIDVGVPRPVNFALGPPRLSAEVLSSRGTLTVAADISAIGQSAARVIDLHLLDNQGRPTKRDQLNRDISPGEPATVEFHIGGLEPGTHQGLLQLAGQDGLAADDTRYFTVSVRPAWRVLLAAPKPAESYALFLAEALAPTVFRKRGQARFECDICNTDELAERKLADYAAVCLLDPAPLPADTWQKLADYATEGGGVGIFLGRNATPVDSFNQPQAQELLPGQLLRQVRRPDGDVRLAPRDYQHPILAAFGSQAGAIPWEAFPVFRYWQVDQPTAGVVLPYSDGGAAVFERSVGRGRALTMTTPVSDRPSQNQNQKPWNLLPVGEAWPFLILVNQMATYLVGGSDQQLNYFAGQTAVLKLDAAEAGGAFLLFTPSDLSFSVNADPRRRELAVSATEQVGNYRLQAGGSGGVDLGFSVNYAPEQTQLERLDEAELAELLAPLKFRLAANRQQIDRDVSLGRVGQELFPLAILLLAAVLAGEWLLANRFY